MAHDILIVDDEADIRMLIGGVLKDEGYATREAGDSTEALAAIHGRQPTLVILDIWLQGSELDGIAILRQLRAEMPSVPVVMISGHGTIETAVEAIMVGASPAVNQLRQQIERVAPTGSRVLISGAPGSGKEVVGRLLHARSRRSQGPFVPVNCATMRPDRLEIELFGCEASNDGSPRKIGTFERAHGGTLFLDEVADMPLETQGKIVRALQEQTFERVGGSRRVEVDVRVVASSNRELSGEISAGRFREDLFYRLNVVPIRVPALRERREDIPLLARHFVQRGAEAARIAARDFGEDALAALQSYTWPGNVRQLRNVIDRAVIISKGPVLHVSLAELKQDVSTKTSPAMPKPSSVRHASLQDALDETERAEILHALEEANWVVGGPNGAAARLGIKRTTLHVR